jgi:hypothetical protein
MELTIGIVIGIVIALTVRRHRVRRYHVPPPAETNAERDRRETDELITTILPTINNDK